MLAVGVLTLVLAAAPELGGPAERLAVIQKAADFTLNTQDNKPLRFADLKGKVVLVSFIFTTCNGTCPATTHRMGQVQEALKKKELDKAGRVRLLSISL